MGAYQFSHQSAKILFHARGEQELCRAPRSLAS